MTPLALTDVLPDIPDPRGRNGRRHPSTPFSGSSPSPCSWAARPAEASVASDDRPAPHALGFRRGNTPTASTLSRTRRRFAAPQLEAILSRWIRGRIATETFDQVTLDGNTLRGSRAGFVFEYAARGIAAATSP